MANDSNEDYWEDLGGDIQQDDLEGEVEGEYIPPGYLAADGPFRHLCTCENYETCDFCKWFHLIKECPTHGKATRRPFKSCTCHDESKRSVSRTLQLTPSKNVQPLKEASSSKHVADEAVKPCTCAKKVEDSGFTCDCLQGVDAVSSDESDFAWYDEKFGEFEEPLQEFENEGGLPVHGEWMGSESEREEEWVEGEFEVAKSKKKSKDRQASSQKQISAIDRSLVSPGSIEGGEVQTAQPCTCGETSSMSGSSTEIETSTSYTSELSSDSYSDLTIGEKIDASSSDPESSERSSVEFVEIDLARARWITAASDESIDRSSSDDGLKRTGLYTFACQRRKKRAPKPERRRADDERIYRYLIYQKNNPENYSAACKNRKEQRRSYSCELMGSNLF